KTKAKEFLDQLGIPSDLDILRLVPWYPGSDAGTLVTDAGEMNQDASGGGFAWLRDQPYAALQTGPFPTSSLLFDVIRHSILWKERLQTGGDPAVTRLWAVPSLNHLATLQRRPLERLLLQGLDLGTN